jgi:hypothetical protein
LFIHLNSIANKLFVVFRVNTYANLLRIVQKPLQSISAQAIREGLFKESEMTDSQVIASVIRYLKAEAGAVSCNVHLPSGKNVVVYADGRVE